MGGSGSGKINAALMRLDGRRTNKDGTVEKTDFFDFLELPEGDYSHIELTAEQATALKNTCLRFKFGTSAAIPLRCLGPKCVYKNCPFGIGEKKNYPLAQSCPIETRFVQAKTKSYVEDLQADPESAIEMSMVNRLVELDIMELRANAALSMAEEAQALYTKVETTSVEGNKEYTSEAYIVHPIIEIKDRHHKQRMQILESLAATRREQYKKAAALKKTDSEDAASYMVKMRKMFDDFKKSGMIAVEDIKNEAKAIDPSEEADWET